MNLDTSDPRAHALEVIQYLLSAQLPPDKWERVAEITEVAIAAVVADDLETLSRAADELIRIAPRRIKKGDGGTSRADQKTSDRMNVLVRAIPKMQPAAKEDKDTKGR